MSLDPRAALGKYLSKKDQLLIRVPKEIECRKCGKLDIEVGTVMVPLGYYENDTPPVIEVGLNCPKCGRHCPTDVEIDDTTRLN